MPSLVSDGEFADKHPDSRFILGIGRPAVRKGVRQPTIPWTRNKCLFVFRTAC